jgi:hypothetical protein
MAVYVNADHVGDAWLQAYEALQPTGQALNLAVAIRDPLREDTGVRRAIERRLVELHAQTGTGSAFATVQSMHTVANTIFPVGLYRPGKPGAADRFMASVARGEALRARSRKRGWGTYVGRLVSYPAPGGGTVNQLQAMLDTLRKDQNYKDRYEAPVVVPHLDDPAAGVDTGAVLHGDRSVDPFRTRGGPCLAHLSLTSVGGQLSMVALYRGHAYETRAYGNFVGLARLLAFLAAETGRQPGELLVVTGHAWADDRRRDELLAAARAAAGEPSRVETGARPAGDTLRDLDLPQPTRQAAAADPEEDRT